MTGEGRDKPLLGQLKHMYLMPFRAIAVAFRTFSRNRARIGNFARRPRVASALKTAMVITMVLWLAIAFYNRDKQDTRLTDALQELWSKTSGDTPTHSPVVE